jgi:chromosome segregation ATPase
MVGDGDPEALVREISRLNEYLHVLKAECLALKEENKKYLREIDDYKKTISKMKYAHDEEVRALEDDLAEAKILNKKAGEYTSMLDADSDAFETILELAKIIHGLAKNAESVSLLIKDEVEGHI